MENQKKIQVLKADLNYILERIDHLENSGALDMVRDDEFESIRLNIESVESVTNNIFSDAAMRKLKENERSKN